MARWRKRAIREVRNELDRFLNLPMNQAIALGDYGYYHGKACRFEWIGNVADLGVVVPDSPFQHEIGETYATAGAVRLQGRLDLEGGDPAVDVSFTRSSALAFRGFKIGYSQVQLRALSSALNAAVEKGLAWEKHWVVVTQVWKATGFTQLVAGGKGAKVEIRARASGASADPSGLFDFADPSLELSVSLEQSMAYCAVAEREVKPYFAVHKLRTSPTGPKQLYRYAARLLE